MFSFRRSHEGVQCSTMSEASGFVPGKKPSRAVILTAVFLSTGLLLLCVLCLCFIVCYVLIKNCILKTAAALKKCFTPARVHHVQMSDTPPETNGPVHIVAIPAEDAPNNT